MSRPPGQVGPRRRALLAALAGAAWVPGVASAVPPQQHARFGRVDPPLTAPALPLGRADGSRTDLQRELSGRVTAVQLMFTGCSAVCPIQGALFAEVARRLPGPDCRLLSLSVDPLGDDAPALQAWLARFGSPKGWQAAVPKGRDVDRLLGFLDGRAEGVDRHTGQVYLFDRRGRLVFRTADLPPPGHVVEVLAAVRG